MRVAMVNKILPFSCVDGPGNRLVIFLQGCNYNCKNCHNPYTIGLCNDCGDCIASCPTGALSWQPALKVHWHEPLCTQCDECLRVCPQQSSPKTTQYSVAQMLALISKHSIFLNGITVSGGEATLQLAFIVELFTAIKATPALQHLSCMVDSNGSLSDVGWQKLLPVLDGAMIDLKAWQQDTHLWITGRSNHRVFQALTLLAEQDKLYEVRLLHIPGQTDFDLEIDALASYLKPLSTATRIKLNAFQHHGVTGEARNWSSCSEAQMERLAEQLTRHGVSNLILPSVYFG